MNIEDRSLIYSEMVLLPIYMRLKFNIFRNDIIDDIEQSTDYSLVTSIWFKAFQLFICRLAI